MGRLGERQRNWVGWLTRSPDPSAILREAEVLWINPAFERCMGKSLAELEGRTFLEVVESSDHRRVQAGLGHLQAGAPYVRVKAHVGTACWEWTVSAHGEAGLYLAVGRDLTEQAQIDEALREEVHRLRFLIDHDSDAISLKDTEGHYELVNPAAASLVGRTVAEILGKTERDVFSAAAAEAVLKQDRWVIEHGRMLTCDLPLEAVVQGMRTYSVTKLPYTTPAGTIRGVATLARDVTELRRTAEALSTSETTLRDIIERATDVIYIKDRSGRYVMVNPAGAALVGLRLDQVVGRTDFERFGSESGGLLRANDERVMAEGIPLTFEERIEVMPGDFRYYSTTKVPYRGPQGEIQGIIGISRDITEQKHREEARRLQFERLQELEQLRSDFVNGVSHELRTPLTSIYGYTEFLAEGIGGPLNDAQQEFVDQIQSGVKRLERLVNDLLDYARIEADTFRLQLEPGDLGTKVGAVVEKVAPQLRDAGLTMWLDLMPGAPAVCMDEQRIEQVLLNLLGNAIKFTPSGGTITVRLRAAADRVRVEVADTGPGVAPEEQVRLFQRFSQLPEGARRGGAGLGLSISKAIVESHGGQIGVETAPGKGSTFWFTLPLNGECPSVSTEGQEEGTSGGPPPGPG